MSQPNDWSRYEDAPPPEMGGDSDFSLTTPELEAYFARAFGDPDGWRGDASAPDAGPAAPTAEAGTGPASANAASPAKGRPSHATPGAPEGAPFPGTEAACRAQPLPLPLTGDWVMVFRPDEQSAFYGAVLSIDLAPGRVVAQMGTEVVELDLTPDLTFFLGPQRYRTKVAGERGALVAERLLDLLVTAPRPITEKALMDGALAVIHEPAGPRDAGKQKKRHWFW